MNSLDLLVSGLVVLSILIGLMRGLTREVLSLLAWFAAVYAARTYAPMLAPMIPGLDAPALANAAALVVVFIAVLIAAGLLAKAMGGMVKLAGLGVDDRILGSLFGTARAALILASLAILAGLTALPKSQVWQTARVHAYLENAATKLKPWLPADLAALIQYH
jgi:membrane protein required for colicin V production